MRAWPPRGPPETGRMGRTLQRSGLLANGLRGAGLSRKEEFKFEGHGRVPWNPGGKELPSLEAGLPAAGLLTDGRERPSPWSLPPLAPLASPLLSAEQLLAWPALGGRRCPPLPPPPRHPAYSDQVKSLAETSGKLPASTVLGKADPARPGPPPPAQNKGLCIHPGPCSEGWAVPAPNLLGGEGGHSEKRCAPPQRTCKPPRLGGGEGLGAWWASVTWQ